ncbi:hypothetical protein CPB84DRAFT_1785399 [Gymnopilus junonius]|uniref:Uncharacterized protein n=1 Tax=Gymnopilus junonius TaxID=109634 RepID=A0A9P5NI03_GYMJU|nr:hypothetical protein CPB84DRAFT_1785399 [Gymnopilus junonius]
MYLPFVHSPSTSRFSCLLEADYGNLSHHRNRNVISLTYVPSQLILIYQFWSDTLSGTQLIH